MSVIRTPQTIAVDVRWYSTNSLPGASYKTYPNGPGAKPVLVEYTRQERAHNALRLAELCDEWEARDPSGYLAWYGAWKRDPATDPTGYAL